MSFLQRLRAFSVDRCEKHFFPLDAWNVLEWAGAAAGEAGETANVAKKMQRDNTLVKLNRRVRDLKKEAEYRKELGKEVADTIIYLDLLCASQGIDLEQVITDKFNEVSEQHGYKPRL